MLSAEKAKTNIYLYQHVDGILYLTQRHATIRNNKLTYPILTIEGADCCDNPWKSEVLDFVTQRWGTWNGFEQIEAGSVEEFSTIDHIPKTAPRYERWRTEYKRNPYLRDLPRDQLRDRFDEVTTLTALSMLKRTPVKFEQEQVIDLMRQFGDLMQELGDRGIPITEFAHSDEREVAACRRLGLSQQVIDFLAGAKRS